MRFSLIDLMWSMTFASLGFATLVIATRGDGGLGFSQSTNEILVFLSVMSLGPLLGASIGRPFHKALIGAFWGMLLTQVILMAVFAIKAWPE